MMRNKIYLLLIFPTLLTFFSACGGNMFVHEIKILDSLNNELGRVETELKQMDTARIDTISMHASNNINTIKHLYVSDTINMQEAISITEYKSLRNVANRFRKKRWKLWDDLHKSQYQINNLLKDLEHQAFDEQTGKSYFAVEKLATISIIRSYEVYREDFEKAVKKYDSLNPVINDIILNLNQSQTEK